MPLLDNDTVIKLYYEEVKRRFPELSHLTFKEVELICKATFRYVKHHMEDPKMPTIILPTFGRFVVYSSRFKTMMKQNDKNLRFERVTQEEHDEIEASYEAKMESIRSQEEGRLRLRRANIEFLKKEKEENKGLVIELIDDTEETNGDTQ